MAKTIPKIMVFFGMLLLSLSLISAQGNINSGSLNKLTVQNAEQIRNQFQNRYQYNCTGNCTYNEVDGKLELKIQEQKRFLFWNVNAEQNYELNDKGEIVNARYNFWSRILNQERVRI